MYIYIELYIYIIIYIIYTCIKYNKSWRISSCSLCFFNAHFCHKDDALELPTKTFLFHCLLSLATLRSMAQHFHCLPRLNNWIRRRDSLQKDTYMIWSYHMSWVFSYASFSDLHDHTRKWSKSWSLVSCWQVCRNWVDWSWNNSEIISDLKILNGYAGVHQK